MKNKHLDTILLILKIVIPLLIIIPLLVFTLRLIYVCNETMINPDDPYNTPMYGPEAMIFGWVIVFINALAFLISALGLIISCLFKEAKHRVFNIIYFISMLFVPFTATALYVFIIFFIPYVNLNVLSQNAIGLI